MEVICKVMEVGNLTQITTASGNNLPKIEVLLGVGQHQILAGAFDKEAAAIASSTIDKDALYVADLAFSVSGSDKKFQNVRLTHLSLF